MLYQLSYTGVRHMRLALLGLLFFVAAAAADHPKYVVPDVPDLTIRTRTVFGPSGVPVETATFFFKGPRSRQERSSPSTHAAGRMTFTWITQCDARRTLLLNPDASTYGYMPIQQPGARVSAPGPGQGSNVEEGSGRDVAVTVDAVDTGERRQMGRMTARHVITTTTIGPGGESVQPGTRVQDGWYVDLPPPDCLEWGEGEWTIVAIATKAGTRRDRIHVTHLGTARRGFPLIETSRGANGPGATTVTTELLDISERPLDPALFEVPAGYRRALPRWSGDFDITRADTLANRFWLLWESASDLVHRFWR
jgi:hypothetical protein